MQLAWQTSWFPEMNGRGRWALVIISQLYPHRSYNTHLRHRTSMNPSSSSIPLFIRPLSSTSHLIWYTSRAWLSFASSFWFGLSQVLSLRWGDLYISIGSKVDFGGFKTKSCWISRRSIELLATLEQERSGQGFWIAGLAKIKQRFTFYQAHAFIWGSELSHG